MSDRRGITARTLGLFGRRLLVAGQVAILCTAVVLAGGCSTVIDGRAVSVFDDPFRVGGLPAADGDSGPRPTRRNRRERCATPTTATSTSWRCCRSTTSSSSGSGPTALRSTVPSSRSRSWCPTTRPSTQPAHLPQPDVQGANAFFTSRCDLIAWDRGSFLPTAQALFRGHVRAPACWRTSTGMPCSRWRSSPTGRRPRWCASSKPTASPASTCSGWRRASRRASAQYR